MGIATFVITELDGMYAAVRGGYGYGDQVFLNSETKKELAAVIKAEEAWDTYIAQNGEPTKHPVMRYVKLRVLTCDDQGRDELDELRARVASLENLARSAECAGADGDGWPGCPWCTATEGEIHDASCDYAQVMAKKGGG